MDVSSISGTALMMRGEQTQQALSISMIKLAADQQSQIANMLLQNAQQSPQPTFSSRSSFSFSIFA
ncbi:MAG: hypothetical protein WCL71_11815 [Deltaproteobacteria bacterium]